MKRIQQSIEIHAPVNKVFDFVIDPNNLPGVWPSLVSCANVVRRPDGFTFDWTYKMAGLHFNGRAETAVYRPREYVEVKNTGGIPSTFRWRYEEKAGITRLTCDVEYSIPMPVLGKLAENAIHRINEKELETLLANIKTAVEVPLPATAPSRPEKRR